MAIWNLFTNNNPKAQTTRARGQRGEDLACRYLKAQGLKIITRNFYCKGGEIDIIAQDKDTLVFVEVRMRKNQRYGGALASVDAAKQHRLRHSAYSYLNQQQINPTQIAVRFDIIAIEQAEQIHWLKNAFGE